MLKAKDTITALCTPPGFGGVGIVRVSGGLVKDIAKDMVGFIPKPRYAHYTHFMDEKKNTLDKGLVLYFPAPHSFTGEAVLEFQGHGGPVILDMILSRIVSLGARLAEPGEFSLRAYLNGKIDLIQAEAMADLINASSEAAIKSAMGSLQGVFSDKVKALNVQVIRLRVWVEAGLDFPDEDLPVTHDDFIIKQLNTIEENLEVIFNTAQQGAVLQEAKTIVLLGAPNVGKSSLLNALADNEVAIVSAIAGTTRDLVRSTLSLFGFTLQLIDTAGIRDGADEVEREGIARAQKSLIQADVILYVRDQLDSSDDPVAQCLIPYQDKVIQVVNKIDLMDQAVLAGSKDKTSIYISVKNNQGLIDLKEALKNKMRLQIGAGVFSARRRHLVGLEQARERLIEGKNLWLASRAGELLAQELRYVSQALESLTGEFTNDDLLSEIFSSFCIGK